MLILLIGAHGLEINTMIISELYIFHKCGLERLCVVNDCTYIELLFKNSKENLVLFLFHDMSPALAVKGLH